jgi:type IV secretory pathway TraG/TraD family ATPase VirD4
MKQKKIKWMFSVMIVSIFVGFFAISLSMGLAFLINSGFSDVGFSYFLKFMKTTFTEPVLLFSRYNLWASKSFSLIASGDAGMVSYFSLLPILLFFVSIFVGYLICPYRHESSLLDDNLFVSLKELKRAGFLKGLYSVIGKFDNNFIRLPEHYSSLIIGKENSLKTDSCTIPAVLSNDTNSIAVIDNEGEIFKKTSGYRSRLGKVYYFDWNRVDKPEMGIFYPRWNPLSEKCLPETSAMREQYFQALSNIFIPDIDSEDIDPYWLKKSRESLDAFMEFIICKTVQASANDYYLSVLSVDKKKLDDTDINILKGYYSSMPVKEARRLIKIAERKKLNYKNYLPIGNWETIPSTWIGKEASLPMLYDWLFSIKDVDTDILLKNLIEEIEFFNYSKSLLSEFNKLLNYTKDQRKEIIKFILEFLKIFSIASVREKTMECDFHYYDLRGEYDENNNKFSPISLYLTFNKNSPTNILSKALIEMSVLSMMSFDNKDNKDLYPVSFIFDDFDKLPKFNEAIKGPSFGKSQRASFMFLINDIENMNKIYSSDDVNLLNKTTSVKIAKDDISALYFSKLVNNDILIKQFSDIGENVKLKKEYQMVFVDKFGKRPIVLNSPIYLAEKSMMALAEIEYSTFVNSADLEQRLYDIAPLFNSENLVLSLEDGEEFDDEKEEDVEVENVSEEKENEDDVKFEEIDKNKDVDDIDLNSKKEAIENFKNKVINEKLDADCEEMAKIEEKIEVQSEEEIDKIKTEKLKGGDSSNLSESIEEDISDDIEKMDVDKELSDLIGDIEVLSDINEVEKNDEVMLSKDILNSDIDNDFSPDENEFKFEPVAVENDEAFDDIKKDLDVEDSPALDNLEIDKVKDKVEVELVDDPVEVDKELDQISHVFSTKSKKNNKANLDNMESLRRLRKNVSNLEVKSIDKSEKDENISNKENLEKVSSELKEDENAWWMDEDVFSIEDKILENPFSKKREVDESVNEKDFLNKSISKKRKSIKKKINLEDIKIDD